jgi:hypothetical protein
MSSPSATKQRIDWVSAQGVIDPLDFSAIDWRLVPAGTPLTITP